MSKTTTAVLGAGSWGTALTLRLARNGVPTRLWGRNASHITAMASEQRNSKYLPEISFPKNLTVHSDLATAIAGAEDILIVVPSHSFRNLLQQLKPILTEQQTISWATKGLDPQTNDLLSEVVKQELSAAYANKVAVLSGPSFAKEVGKDIPTAVTLASNDAKLTERWIDKFHCELFRLYLSDDLVGVQLAGTLKNVLAIATGVADGMGYGANTRAALITRGLVEIKRLGAAMGADPNTFDGLAGLGDLVLTCTDNQSRNRRFGLALGAGKSAEQAKADIGQVVEGAQNADQVMKLADKFKLELPICQQIYNILHNRYTPREALHKLMTRPVRYE